MQIMKWIGKMILGIIFIADTALTGQKTLPNQLNLLSS